MRKRELQVLKDRIYRLQAAIMEASVRLNGTRASFKLNIAVTGIEYQRKNKRLHVQLVITTVTLPSWRVGPVPDEELFEVKLVPELHSIVLPQERYEGEDRETFLEVSATDLIQIYSGIEIQKIIRLLSKLQPSTKEVENDGITG